jgi:hypothetical protein
MNYQDLIIIIIIFVLIAIAIIINVKKMFNDKLSHVEIKVPEIEIPQSNIIVKVQRECSSDNFDVHIEKEPIKSIANKAKLSPNNYTKMENIEEFESTPQPPTQSISEQEEKKHEIEQEQKYNKKHVQYTCIPTKDVFSGDYDPRNVRRYNIDIVNEIIDKDKIYDGDTSNYKTRQYFLKLNRYASVSYDNDIVKGGNILDCDGFAGVNDIGIIDINNATTYPKPKNY